MANSQLDRVKGLIDSLNQHTKSAAKSGAGALKNGLGQVKQAGQKLILYIPKDYQASTGSSLNDLVKAAEALGIEVHRSEKNGTALAKELFGTTEKLLGFSERGIALFAPQFDKLLNKNQKLSKSLGGSSEALGQRLNKTQTALSALQSFLGTAIAGMDLDSLLRRRRNGEDVSGSELAKAGVDLAAQLVDNIASATGTVDAFAEQLGKLAMPYLTLALSGLASKLNNLPDLSLAGPGFDAVSGILSVVSASFILSNKDADAGTKAAAGIEISTKILGNIGKAVSQYIIAQRVAAGLSTTAATGGLIGSVVALAISPLSFLNVADKFERAKQLEQYSERFKKFGYEGDSLLASFYRETGAIEAALTTINSVLSAASAGVGAAATGSLVGAPVAALVSAITGIISGILDASKQAIFERVATKLANKIDEWEKKHGKNYFENGYDARHSAFLEDTFELLSQYNKEYSVERVVAITQQRWDVNIGELAGITRKGADAKSGKAYVDFFEEGKLLEKDPDRFDKKVFDPLEGKIDLSSINKTTLLKFITPVFTAGEEIRERKQTGKYEYMTELFVKGKEKWVVTGVESHNAIYDYTNLIQLAIDKKGEKRQVTIESHLGEKNDRIYLSSGSSIVYAGNGHDVAYYDKTDTGYLTFDGQSAQKAGEYIVTKELKADVKVLKEVVKTQDISVGKTCSEKLEYRDYELSPFELGNGIRAKDELHSVEEIIGSNRKDKFFGSRFTDIFHGAKGDDEIYGNDGHDILYGDDGNDVIHGGDGNDHLVGGNGNDRLIGGKGNNFLNGGDGDDELQVFEGQYNVLLGGAGNDILYGSDGTNLFDGGVGNDKIYGGLGKDIYRYSKEYGRHIIIEKGGDDDTLLLSDLSFKDVGFIRIGDDLLVNKRIGGTLYYHEDYNGNALTIKDWFKEGKEGQNNKIEKIVDKDGAYVLSQYLTELTAPGRGINYFNGLEEKLYYGEGYNALPQLRKDIEQIISSTGALTGEHGQVLVGAGGPLAYSNSPNSIPNAFSNYLTQSA
uniref:RTX-I toxin determinant A from serotypes 5/10 n=1 Tax=Actinobacillus pleuropneumoniae TaxID=715 RepID=RTX12_ACTPL|nr:RecName: Full=RTX-I toxin determinant A from serotypes 5/10; AltName: Full=APX-IA; AltName: Full=Cytolysin IA; Short=CLY-IA; AltName: Full=Hemolysin IA; Short=HLY-IA [Actinobacillus pleuropneumoniae]BAA04014.1 RTX toxin I type L [Actinobacillus pleuropneumoniae]